MSREPWWEWDAPRERWLLTERDCNGWPRSLLLEVCARIVFPTVLVLSVYLLFAGHNNSGGGFTGGLVAGLAFVLRYLAGGKVELSAVVRVRPPVVIGTGLSIAVITALVPALFGLPVLTTAVWPLGPVKIVTSLFLDVGVYLLIVGVVVDLLGTLGVSLEEDR
ncbi:MnhB domain-containing protein [Allokutzneria albata]|uniref:Multisubunit sodium/proton antiporter, MrpB subunit n=1 Tax=Allokutzneria albata TaxID=211114 RepID=A0A1G9UN45_ALLAB|nr:MnhB domain-containing protein [Allokutzneria albata]SDM61372.1 multisubunit sodium/proton antiporter, MrpB subunit [Allokutzneria albata]